MNEQCPRCESFKTQKTSKIGTFLALIGTGSCLIWIGFLFWPLWILAALFILVSPLGFFIPKLTTCKDCKYSWKPGEAPKYKKAIEDIQNARIVESTRDSTMEVTSTKEVVDNQPVEKLKSEPSKNNDHINTFSFPVVGLNYEGRRKKLAEIIKQHKDDGYFFMDPYEGFTNKEILEESYGEKIYELTSEGLPFCELEKEDDNDFDPNAIRVLISDVDGISHHIGYVPKEHCVGIREFIGKYEMSIVTTVTGGKYKVVDYDDLGEEKVRTRTTGYGLDIFLTFSNNYMI